MSSWQGVVWFVGCLITAMCLWIINVVFIDNAVPQVLVDVKAALPYSIIDMDSWCQLFLVIARLSPLFLIAVGILGWIALSVIYGRRDYEYGY
jgi:hypothetical protein